MGQPYNFETQIASGSAVSSPFSVRNLQFAHTHVPSYAAGAMFLQGSTDATSANFRRLTFAETHSADVLNYGTGAGGRVVPMAFALGLPYVRVELNAAATITLSLQVTGRA